jgi:GNAT superfamily N-acetyltransferase
MRLRPSNELPSRGATPTPQRNLRDSVRRNRQLRGLVQLAGYLVRRRNCVVWEADLTVPRAPTTWAPGERALEIGPENLDAVMTPTLLAFLGGDRMRQSLEDIRRGNRLLVVVDDDGYAAYGHIVVNSAGYMRVLGEREPVPHLGNFFTAPRARRRGLFKGVLNESQRVLQRLGYGRALLETRPTNAGSMKGSERMGMRITRHLRGWIVFDSLVIQRDIHNRGRWQAVRR